YGLRHEFPIKELLQLVNITRSTYYYWMKQLNYPNPNAEVKELIQVIKTMGVMASNNTAHSFVLEYFKMLTGWVCTVTST
ncbi:hypothetical protein AB0854_24405, partial [Bacillus cereus]